MSVPVGRESCKAQRENIEAFTPPSVVLPKRRAGETKIHPLNVTAAVRAPGHPDAPAPCRHCSDRTASCTRDCRCDAIQVPIALIASITPQTAQQPPLLSVTLNLDVSPHGFPSSSNVRTSHSQKSTRGLISNPRNMYRLTTVRAAPRLASSVRASSRTFSVATRKMAEGDAGAPRSGGSAQGDAFTKREQASEDYYVRQQEREKLVALREKLNASQKELDKHKLELEELEKKSK